MWLALTRAPLPDVAYWPGRRLLALVDAAGWPVAWIALAAHLPQPTGIAGPAIIAFAAVCALGRVHRAFWLNHRYHFTTWRWGRVALGLLLFVLVLKMALPT